MDMEAETTIGKTLRARLALMTQDELAALLEVSRDTLREWRRGETGPDYIRAGKAIMYRESDVKAWMERNAVVMMRTGT